VAQYQRHTAVRDADLDNAAPNISGLESAPVPRVLDAGGQAAVTLRLWPLWCDGRVDGWACRACRALAIVAAKAHLLPLAILALAPIASPMLLSVGVEHGMLVEPHQPLRVLGAEHAAALPTMVAAVEEGERGLAGRRRADGRGIIRLQTRLVSSGEAAMVCMAK